MSILETFYILFKSDVTDLKKGSEEVDKSTKKLTESLKNVNNESLRVGRSFLNIATQLTGIIAGFLSVNAVIKGLSSATEYTIELSKASKLLGVNASQLDIWGKVLQRNGGSVEGFRNSLKSLAGVLGTTEATALKVLPKLADNLSRLSRFNALRYGKLLGLDEATILLLQQGRRELEAQINKQKELGYATEKDIEISDAFNEALQTNQQAFQGLFLTISSEVLPVLTKFLDYLTPIVVYLRKHKDLVIGAFIGIGIAAAIMLAPIIAANAAFLLLVAGVTALIAAFAIAYEDIKAFLAGHESLTGDILKKWPGIGIVVTTAINAWKLALEGLSKAFHYLISLFDKVKGFFGGNSNISVDIKNGQNLINEASQSPIGIQSPTNNFNSRSFDRNTSINTGPITIQTQATDAVGVSKGLGKGLQEHLWHANNEFADGVSY